MRGHGLPLEDALPKGHDLVAMNALHIHIGMPKTGTSLIQAVLAGMRKTFATNKIWIPPTFIGAHRLAVEATPRDSKLHERSDFVHIKAVMSLEQALAESQPPSPDFHTAVMSSEYFSLSSPRLLREILCSHDLVTPDTTIVAVLRRQDRIMVSGFNQSVKAINRTQPLVWNSHAQGRLDWYALLAPWAEEFGRAAVKVQVFDRMAAGRESLTSRVLDACGITYDLGQIVAAEDIHSKSENRSLPAELLAFKFVANAVTKMRELNWLIKEAIDRGIGNGTYKLDAETTRRIIEYYRASNRRVATEYLGESGDLFDDRIDPATHTTLDVQMETLSRILAICGTEVERLRTVFARAEKLAAASAPAEFDRIVQLEWLLRRAMAAGVAGGRYRLPKALAQEIVEYYKSSNLAVARRFLKEDALLSDDVIEDAQASAGLDVNVMAQLVAVLAAEIGELRRRAGQRTATQRSSPVSDITESPATADPTHRLAEDRLFGKSGAAGCDHERQ